MRLLLLTLIYFTSSALFAQQYYPMQVHQSVNDIMFYRNLFSSNNVKSISFIYGENTRIFSIDKEGKITKEEEAGEYPYLIIYNYEGGNLVSYTGPYAHSIYVYDSEGNVLKESDGEIEYNFKYDKNNNLLRSEIGDQSIEAIGIVSTKYEDTKIIEKIFDCMGEGDYNRYYKITYAYDQGGNLMSIVSNTIGCYDKSVKSESVTSYEYNEKGLPIKEVTIHEDGSETISTFSYEYY